MLTPEPRVGGSRRHSLIIPIAFLAAAMAIFAGCVTVPVSSGDQPVPPTLSWWADPATSMALSWFGVSGISGIELRDSSGSVVNVDAEISGPVTRVLVDDLAPDTTYDYRARFQNGEVAGRWRSFVTAPAAGAEESNEIAFAVAGDLQPFNDETIRTTTLGISRVASLDPLFILQVGDVAEVGISRRSWSVAASVLSSAGGEIPFLMTAGNHDYYYGIPSTRYFKTFFPAPYAGEETLRKETWYSQRIGSAHIAVLDTEAGGDRLHAQMEWLRHDLAGAKSQGARWLFISMHRPILATATGAGRPEWGEALFPIIAEYGVTAVFWGHDHMYEHYEYQYGANGYVINPGDPVAVASTHFFTAGTIGARVDALYPGFFTHRPFAETWEMVSVEDNSPEKLEFEQRPWNPAKVLREQPGIRYQDPDRYPDAASYYSYPFDNAADAVAGRYSTNPEQIYSDDAEFFGYTYGETSIHYLWVEIQGDRCIITAHYIDGADGEHGTVIASPDGRQERWVISRPE